MKKVVLMMTLGLLSLGAAQEKHDEAQIARLVTADGRTGVLSVLDLESGQVLSSFGTPGKVSGLYKGPSGQYVYGIHRDHDRVTVLDTGLLRVTHGDHQDVQVRSPHVLATLNVGPKPTHFFSHNDQIVIFNDGDGTVPIFGEELLGKTNDMKVVQAVKADHGAPALLDNTLLVGMLSLNRIDAFDAVSGKLLKSIEGCPGVHGEAIHGQTVYFGCANGVLGVTVQGHTITYQHLGNPAATPEKVRVGTVVTHAKSPIMFGNFGPQLASWTAQSRSLTAVPLPAAPLKFLFSEDGQSLLVLTVNGQLHRLDPRSGKVLASVAVVPAYDANDKNALRPTFTQDEERLIVASPMTGELVVLDLSSWQIKTRLKVGGAPSLVAISSAHGTHHMSQPEEKKMP